MATRIKQIPKNRNATRTSVSISGPAYTVAVGGAPRGSKAKTRKHTSRIMSRYLRPSTGSCHDLCKHGMKDESVELKRPARRFGSRKRPVIKNNGVKRTVDHVEKKKITKTNPRPFSYPKIRAPAEPVEVVKRENSLPSKKVGFSKQSLSKNRKVTQNDPKMPKNRPTDVKTKPAVIAAAQLNVEKTEKDVDTVKNTLISSMEDQITMTKTELNQLITEKVQEITLHEAEISEFEFVTPTVTTDSTDLLTSEKQISNLEPEHTDNEEVIVYEDDYEMETSEGNCKYRVVICEDKEDGGLKVKFRRGRFLEVNCEDDGPTWLKFRRGKVLEDDSNFESETVNLKHQEGQNRKEARELFNRVIEETASKLVEVRKTKVGALVGAFETVISLQDDIVSSE